MIYWLYVRQKEANTSSKSLTADWQDDVWGEHPEHICGAIFAPSGTATRVEGGKRDPRWETILEFARALELEPLLIPRDRLAAVDAAMNLSASDDVPPLTGGQW